jgi:thiol-disulfide isomerase/thioredoxin
VITRAAITIAAVLAGGGLGLAVRRLTGLPGPSTTRIAPAGLVVVTAPYCSRCRVLLDRIADVASDLRPEVRDVREHRELAKTLDIRTAPTLLVIDPTGQVVDRHDGFPSNDRLERLLASSRRVSQPLE